MTTLKAFLDVYKESVEECDKLGFSEIYKRETKRFLSKLSAHFKQYYELDFTPQDVQYEDGYFFFGHGTNSIVRFHVKEAPGWLFGIWWTPVEENKKDEEPVEYRKDCIKCEFFAQYEETIDKFKPSASMFEGSFNWYFETPNAKENLWRLCFDAARVVKLILQYPYVAFVREIHWSDLNEDYVTPEEAEQIYTEWKLKDNAKKLMQQQNDKEMLDCLTKIFKPLLDKGEAYISDMGANFSPRYELIARNWNDKQENGIYSLFHFDFNGIDSKASKELWDKTKEQCKARAKKIDSWWFNPVSECIYVAESYKYAASKELNERRTD